MVKGLKIIIENIYDTMQRTNPEFKSFLAENENKTIEDIAMEFDIDLEVLKSNL